MRRQASPAGMQETLFQRKSPKGTENKIKGLSIHKGMALKGILLNPKADSNHGDYLVKIYPPANPNGSP